MFCKDSLQLQEKKKKETKENNKAIKTKKKPTKNSAVKYNLNLPILKYSAILMNNN